MGHEFEMYEIIALTLMRNDKRAASFTANVEELEERASKLPSTPHWCMTPGDVVRCLCLKTRLFSSFNDCSLHCLWNDE